MATTKINSKGFIARNWRRFFVLLTFLSDGLAIILSAVGAYYLRNLFPNAPRYDWTLFVNYTLFYAAVIFVFNLLLGLYRSVYKLNTRRQFFIAAKSHFFSIIIILSALYIFQQDAFPRRFTFIFLILYPLIYGAGRFFLRLLNLKAQKLGMGISKSIIISNHLMDGKIIKRFFSFPELGYRIAGYISFNGRDEKYQPRYKSDELEDVIKKENIDTVFIVNENVDSILDLSKELITNGLSQIAAVCQKHNIKLKILSPETESILRFAYIRDIGGIPLYIPNSERIEKFKSTLKRIFDIAATSLIIILLSPIYLITALAILIEDGSPIVFKQKRALVSGKNEFDFLKFRSMAKDAETKQLELYEQNQTSGGLFLLENDPRVTKVGKFIRKYSIDELPQLFNVLKGDMSLVGPRPLSISDLTRITPENSLGGYYVLRSNTKPGVTGLWQISGRRNVSFKEMVLLDLYYIENQSMFLDLEILFETVPVVLFGRGGY